MSKSRHTEAQMIGSLKQLAASVKPKTWRGRLEYEFATAMRAADAGSALLALPSSLANPEPESVV